MRNRCLVCLVLAAAVFSPILAQAQVPALINYQGRLLNGTNLYNGTVNLKLSVYNSETEPLMLLCADTGQVSVVDGLYSTYVGDGLAFGDMSWTGQNGDKWIEVVINTVTMRPRERLVSVPFAMLSGGVTNGAINTMMIGNGAVLNGNLADGAVDSAKIQDGSIGFGDIAVNAAANGQVMKWNGSAWAPSDDNVDGGGESLFGYDEYGMFMPSPSANGMEVIAMGLGCSAGGAYSVVGGGAYNAVVGAYYGTVSGGGCNTNAGAQATIGGGYYNLITLTGSNSVIAGGWSNTVEGRSSAIGGGKDNRIGPRAAYSVIAGGQLNLVSTTAYACVIAGGYNNLIEPGVYQGFIGAGGANKLLGGDYGFIGAGLVNRIGEDAAWGFIGGGRYNTIDYAADYATIGGGYSNTCLGSYATIPGGMLNRAEGTNSFAAGRRAHALHDNTFVWADGQEADFVSSNANSFLVRATNGVGINTPDPQENLHVVGDANRGAVMISPSVSYDDERGATNFPGVAELLLSPYKEYHGLGGGILLRYHGSNHVFTVSAGGSTDPFFQAQNGVVGILTTNTDSTYALSVGGKIRSKGVVVESDWADFVFDDGYRLPPLVEVEQFVREERRLPGIPSASEVAKDGVDLGEMHVRLLQKIEELTLYTIQQEKRIAELERQAGARDE
jgi:trimeric autotransporter adhesin